MIIPLAIAAVLNQTKAVYGPWGIDTEYISQTVKPGDDFYTYVNEGWLKSAKIPEGAWDHGMMDVLADGTNRNIQGIIDDALKTSAPSNDPRRQLADLYRSFLDTDRIERLGLTPLKADLDSILAIKTHEDVARWMADPRSSSLVGIFVFADEGNTDRWLVHMDQQSVGQPILGLPRPENYTSFTGSSPSDRAAYSKYVEKLFQSAIRYIVQNSYHSPAPYRVNGVVRNIDAWYKAFNVTPDEKLYLAPKDRVRLW